MIHRRDADAIFFLQIAARVFGVLGGMGTRRAQSGTSQYELHFLHMAARLLKKSKK